MSDSNKMIIGNIDISPNIDFDSGIHFSISATAGQEDKEIISTLPDYFKISPITYFLELLLNDAEQGETVISTLESLKQKSKQIIPEAQNLLNNGVSINFRHVAKSVFVDISLDGLIAMLVETKLSSIKLNLSDFSESAEFSIVSGIKIDNILDIGYEEILKMGTLFKVQGQGQIPVKLFDSIVSQIETNFSSSLTSNIILGMKTLKLLGALRKIQYISKYDSNVLYDYIKEFAGKIVHKKKGGGIMDDLNHEMGTQIIESDLSQVQEKAKNQLGEIKQGLTVFLEPYLESIKALNLDEISMICTMSKFNSQIQIKFKICIVGLTEYLKNYILN